MSRYKNGQKPRAGQSVKNRLGGEGKSERRGGERNGGMR